MFFFLCKHVVRHYYGRPFPPVEKISKEYLALLRNVWVKESPNFELKGRITE